MNNKKHLQVVDFSNPNADKIISTSTKYMSNETKQNSIDWLIEKLTPSITLQQKYIDNIKKQAKEMYKKELELAYEDGKEIRHILNTIEKNQF